MRGVGSLLLTRAISCASIAVGLGRFHVSSYSDDRAVPLLPEKDGYVVLQLSDSSRRIMEHKIGKTKLLKNHACGHYVVVKRALTSEDLQYYAPFNGRKLSFRLKGYLLTEDGNAVVSATEFL